MKIIRSLSIAVALASAPLMTATAVAQAPSAGAARDSRLTIPVEGMACGQYASRITSALRQIDGVKSVDVSLDKKRAVVTCDAAKVRPEQVLRAINDLGFKAGAPTKT